MKRYSYLTTINPLWYLIIDMKFICTVATFWGPHSPFPSLPRLQLHQVRLHVNVFSLKNEQSAALNECIMHAWRWTWCTCSLYFVDSLSSRKNSQMFSQVFDKKTFGPTYTNRHGTYISEHFLFVSWSPDSENVEKSLKF